MQEAVLKLKEIGVPPEGFESSEDFSEEVLDLWDEWQDAVESIHEPITWEDAEVLIKCCPTDRMAGIEWTILHCIESCFSADRIKEFEHLINQCNSEMMKELLLKRLEKTIQNKNYCGNI